MASYEKNLSSLLAAEEKANKIISNAEDKRDAMKNEAVQRAKEEVEELRAQMDEEFEKGKVDTTKEELIVSTQTNSEIAKNEKLYEASKDKIADLLLERILNVTYELQRNVKGDFSALRNKDAMKK